MAEEEIKIDGDTAGEDAASAPDMPMMADMMGGTGTGQSGRFEVNVKIWILVVAALSIMAPYFLFYHLGYGKGYDAIFQPEDSKVRKKTEFNESSFLISDMAVNLRDPDASKYLEFSIQITLRDDAELSECIAKEVELRDVLISSISAFKALEIDSVPEQGKLKRLIRDVMNATLNHSRVVDVYFRKFRIKALKPENYISMEDNK